MLERRLERQQQAARKRKIIIISTSVVLVVAVAAVATTLIVKKVADDNEKARWTACNYVEYTADPFEGLPDTVPTGIVAVTFRNEGTEMHEIGIARINRHYPPPT